MRKTSINTLFVDVISHHNHEHRSRFTQNQKRTKLYIIRKKQVHKANYADFREINIHSKELSNTTTE